MADDLSKYPLPDGVEDAVLNRVQLADAFGVTEVTIDRWVREAMPVAEKGTNGKAYKFQLSECWAWKQSKDAAERAEREKADSAVAQLRLTLLGGDEGDTEMSLPTKERAALYEAEQKYMAAARMRGDLIQVDQVIELVESLMLMFRDSLDALPDVLERDVNLTGEQVVVAITACDKMVEQLRARIVREHLGDRPDDPPDPGVGKYMS